MKFKLAPFLQNVESTQAKVVVHADHLATPEFFSRIAAFFPQRVLGNCTDAAPSCILGEICMPSIFDGFDLLHFLCNVHRFATCRNRIATLAEPIVDGSVKMPLSLSGCSFGPPTGPGERSWPGERSAPWV